MYFRHTRVLLHGITQDSAGKKLQIGILCNPEDILQTESGHKDHILKNPY